MAFKKCSPSILSRRFVTCVRPNSFDDEEAETYSEPEMMIRSSNSVSSFQDDTDDGILTDSGRMLHPKTKKTIRRKEVSVLLVPGICRVTSDTPPWETRSTSMVSERVSICSTSSNGSFGSDQ
jgi:hypothetical protein